MISMGNVWKLKVNTILLGFDQVKKKLTLNFKTGFFSS